MSLDIKHRVLPQHAKAVRADLTRIADAVSGASTLAPGATGPAVTSLQRTLRGLNLYAGPLNGQYDPATEAAVKKLEGQIKGGAPADGIVDGAELKEMRSREMFVKPNNATQMRVGQKGADVMELESKLHNLGYRTGTVDGVFDQKTAAAVRAYRKDDKSVPDHIAGAGPLVMKGLRHQVHSLEQNLTKLGRHPGKVDDTFTNKTAAAVKAFQKKHHLAPTGIANAKTRAEISAAANGGISARTQKFIDIAKAQQGKPYVWGAEGPNAFDCSGLIDYSLNKAGVKVPRLTADGYMDMYKNNRVDRAHLKPGDLVFFWYPNSEGISRGNASHIEIYLGHGMTMGTDNPSEGARVEPIDWGGFIGGARVPGLQH
jgi:peptidoglycan hydrolase-like protein with peptidoglycan-binding domain